MKNKNIKIIHILLSMLMIIPSIIYLIQNKTVMGFNIYYNFFINTGLNKTFSTIIYLILFIASTTIYLIIINKKEMFENIKNILKYVAIISIIFLIMLPWTSSDIFYYMGVGELDSKYNQNPYYITMKEYYEKNEEKIQDEILEQGANNFWANTTVVYGPIAQLIFKICTSLSMKNINICLFIFKLLNVIIHISNCYLIYKISKKQIFSIIYGLNPFILIECIGNVHNDVLIVFLVLLSIYFLLKKKNILLSIIYLALATGIKYFTILLLPIIILYHFRNEKKISTRILKCFQYGIIFLIIFALEYILYFKDIQVVTAMLAQTAKFSKSIYSAVIQIDENVMILMKGILLISFFIYYAKLIIDLITERNIKFYKIIRKYNIALILALLTLTSFQQWYLTWLFAIIMWQKPNMIRNIIGLTSAIEIANSVYMFKVESYRYDILFVGITICLLVIWQITTNKKLLKEVTCQ